MDIRERLSAIRGIGAYKLPTWDGNRQTGRTSNMLETAAKCLFADPHDYAVIVAANHQQARLLEHEMKKLTTDGVLSKLTGVNDAKDRYKVVPFAGANIGGMSGRVFIDHYTYESVLNTALSQIDILRAQNADLRKALAEERDKYKVVAYNPDATVMGVPLEDLCKRLQIHEAIAAYAGQLLNSAARGVFLEAAKYHTKLKHQLADLEAHKMRRPVNPIKTDGIPVRCKDCQFAQHRSSYWVSGAKCTSHDMYVRAYDYCSMGRRRVDA